MRKTIVCGLLMLVWAWATTASGQQNITLNFRDADLMAVLEFYSKLTGKVFVPSEQVAGTVTVISPGEVDERQAIKLLFSILDMRGLAVVETDDFYKIVPKSSALNTASDPLRPQMAGDRLVTEVIRPKYLQVAAVFESVRALISQEGKLVADANLNFLAVTDTAANVKNLKQVIAQLDKPTALPVSRSYQLQYAKVAELAPLVTALVQGAAGLGGAAQPSTVLQDVRSNTLIVSAPAAVQRQVAEVLQDLDTRSAQVLLEATIVEVTLKDSNKFGVQWQFFLSQLDPTATLSLGDGGGLLSGIDNITTREGLTFGLLRPGDYAALLDLLASDSNARILSSPHLMASNNQEAALRVGDEVPILKEFRLDDDNNPIQTFDRQKVGLEIKITPNIAANRDVSLQLYMNISSLTGGSTANNQFTTSEREVQTNVVVKDRQALVISGLMRDNANESSDGVPFARKLPGVGKLLGSESSDGEKGELLILIRPHVITSEDEARLVSDDQLRKHPQAVDAGAINHDVLEFDL